MKQYKGVNTGNGYAVTVQQGDDTYELDPRYDLRRHSPSGFAWGDGGGGSGQLALALCADAAKDDQQAEKVYQAFRFLVVAGLPEAGWSLTEREILDRIRAIVLEPSALDVKENSLGSSPEAFGTSLCHRIGRHLVELARHRPTTTSGIKKMMWERGRMESIQNLASCGGLTNTGQIEAARLLDDSQAWLRERCGEASRGLTR